jgi:phospholipid/cholesterol/gamma-HCH transport system substrate-binding protein
MGSKRSTYTRFLIVFALIGGLGFVSSIYTLLHQRASIPFFSNTYTVKALFTAGDGVVSGLGQPVNVVGVKVGEVTGSELQDGQALITMAIDRHQLPQIYANATAELRPITPLMDMEIELNPGTRAAGVARPGTTIDVGQTTSPVPLSDLLASLDGDTRDFLGSLIASLGQGTAGRGSDIHAMLAALGPTAADAAQITTALAARRTALAQLVHNLAIVTRAAGQDHQLASVVEAGDQTVRAMAAQDEPLRSALAQLPSTLAVTRSTLVSLEPFAEKLGPTLTALTPAVDRLPQTFAALAPFATEGTTVLKNELEPLITDTQPLARALAPTVTNLYRLTPYLSGSFQALEYLVNELAYNPNVGDNQGFLFWLAWFVHNFGSVVSSGDANGGIGRAAPLATCYGLQGNALLQQLLGVAGLCPK